MEIQSELDHRYDKLDPAFRVPGARIRVHCPYRIIHSATGVVLTEGEAIFENGKAIVMVQSRFHSICGPIDTPSTLDHTLHFVRTHPDYEFQWAQNADFFIEQDYAKTTI